MTRYCVISMSVCTYLRNLEDKKQSVLGSIEEQGKLTEELKARIEAAETLVVLEDLYRPYKQKRKTRASVAKEKGLEPLAAYILEQNAAAPLDRDSTGLRGCGKRRCRRQRSDRWRKGYSLRSRFPMKRITVFTSVI